MMLFLIPAALAAVARYLSFRVRYESSELIIRSGILFRNERHVPYTRIQNLEAVRNIFHRAFGVVEVMVENAAGKDPEARISVLPLAAFEEMRRRVFEGRTQAAAPSVALADPDQLPVASAQAPAVPTASQVPLLTLSLRELLLCGFIENRGLVVIGTIYGFFWQWGPIGDSWRRLFGDESYATGRVRDTMRGVASGNWPPVEQIAVLLAGVVGLLVIVRVVSMAWAAFRLYGFRLTVAGQDLRSEFGLFTRVASTTPLRRIQTMTIRESPLHRLVKRVSIRVQTAGSGGGPGAPGGGIEREWLAPIIPVSALPAFVDIVLPDLHLAAMDWQAVHPRAFRRAVKPAIVLAVTIAAALAAAMGWWALGVLPVTLAWFVLAARKHVDHLGWAATDDLVVFRSGWLWRITTVARVAKIQAVTLRESPFDRRSAMARVRVDTAGGRDPSHRVDIPYLPHAIARDLHRRLALGAAETEFKW